MSARPIRNIAIIAHVDHGKTTLVDQLLRQSGTFAAHQQLVECVMDSWRYRKERGITILSKTRRSSTKAFRSTSSTPWATPTSAVKSNVLGMVDGVVLLVDAAEGPMPQNPFRDQEGAGLGLRPIVLVNKGRP